MHVFFPVIADRVSQISIGMINQSLPGDIPGTALGLQMLFTLQSTSSTGAEARNVFWISATVSV
jgi:hypothetical protein